MLQSGPECTSLLGQEKPKYKVRPRKWSEPLLQLSRWKNQISPRKPRLVQGRNPETAWKRLVQWTTQGMAQAQEMGHKRVTGIG